MDVFAGAAFGLQVDSVKNPKDPFIRHAHDLLFGRQWLIPILGNTVMPSVPIWFQPMKKET